MVKFLSVWVIFAFCIISQHCGSVSIREKRSAEDGGENTPKADDNATEPVAATRRNFFMPYPPRLDTKGRPPKPPPNEFCPRMQPIPTERKCRRVAMKDKDKKCETKDCLFSPSVGYTVPPSYFDLFNIPQYYRYMFSKEIVNFGFQGYGQQGSQHGILQMLLAQMGKQQPHYGFQSQQGYSQFVGQGYSHGLPQTGYSQYGQQGYPSLGGQSYPVMGDQGYSVGGQNYPVMGDQGYSVGGQGYPSMGGQQPSIGGMLPYGHNPYSQTQGSYQQYPQYPQSQYPSDYQQQNDAAPQTRSFGFDTQGGFPYMQQHQQQSSNPTSRPVVAEMCRKENQACQCKTETDCSCKGRRPRMCTQQYTDERGLFYVWEYVTIPAVPPTGYQEPVLKSGDSVPPTFDQQSPTAYSADDYQNQQQAPPAGQYQLRQKWLYFKKPSGCNCQTMKANKPSSYNFFG